MIEHHILPSGKVRVICNDTKGTCVVKVQIVREGHDFEFEGSMERIDVESLIEAMSQDAELPWPVLYEDNKHNGVSHFSFDRPTVS